MSDTHDVIDLLVGDHRLLEVLLGRLDEEERPAEMRTLFLRIADELAAHEVAEHDVVFPAARAALAAQSPELLQLDAEHDEANSLLAEMLALDPAGFGFAKRASALVFELRAHFAAEEEWLFTRLGAALSPEERAELGERVRMAKYSAPTFPCT